jgi:bacteriorhodopsin
MALLHRSNDALSVNPNLFHYPSHADIANSTHGSDWLWAVTALFALSTLLILGFSFLIPRRARSLHYLAAAVTLVATIDYFTMASNLGFAAIGVEFVRNKAHVVGFTREIYYVRYIDWFITASVRPPHLPSPPSPTNPTACTNPPSSSSSQPSSPPAPPSR